MKFFNLQLSTFFRSSAPIMMNIPVCKSISHFNWFARYDDLNEVGAAHPSSLATTMTKP
ncbi:hypothetical protein [uncultured Paraglaciecola sp.]|uniref:hypothetical protein n=1 Tax=uncultured Paraglaciecola sp. TaxID=1765024 RepID=UPI0030DAD315